MQAVRCSASLMSCTTSQVLVGTSLSVLKNRLNGASCRLLQAPRPVNGLHVSRSQLLGKPFGQGRRTPIKTGRASFVARSSREPEPGSDLEADAGYENDPPYRYRAAQKKYADLRFSWLSTTAIVGLCFFEVWAHWGETLSALQPDEPEAAVHEAVIETLVAAQLLLRPSFHDMQNLRRLGENCVKLRQALPSGFKPLPLNWDSNDEAELTELLRWLPVTGEIGVTVAVIFFVLWRVGCFFFPILEEGAFAVFLAWVLAAHNVVSDMCKILAKEARKERNTGEKV